MEVFQEKQNILLFDYQNLPQQYISSNLQNFTEMRDLFNEPSPLVPILILAKLVASLVNATLFSKVTFAKFATNVTKKIHKFPTMTPHFQMINTNDNFQSSAPLHRRQQADNQEPDQFVQSRSIKYNFGYCNIRKSLDHADISLLRIFRISADLSVWFCLVLAIILVSILISVASVSLETGFSQFKSPAFLATLSVLLTPGISQLSSVYRPSIFILWMLMCVIMATYYSSSLTSILISPSPEAKMKILQHLKERRYNLLYFKGGQTQQGLNATIERTINHYATSEMKPPSKVKINLETLRILMKRLIIVDKVDHIPTLATSTSSSKDLTQRYAVIGTWSQIFFYMTRALDYLSKLGKAFKGRTCHVGKELFLGTSSYYRFTPPGSVLLRRSFNRLVEAGILNLWTDEVNQIAAAQKVQHRCRIKSSVEIFKEQQPPLPLEIEGKIFNVFALWATCLTGSLLCNIVELFSNKFRKVSGPLFLHLYLP